MAQNVGGFYASLKMESDQASFDKSKKEIKGVEDQTKKTGIEFDKFVGSAIKGLALLGGAAVGAAFAVSNIQAKMALNAKSAGLGYLEYSRLSSAMKLVGLDADEISGKMGAVNSAIASQFSKDASPFNALAEDLAVFSKGRLTIDDIKGMTAEQRILSASEIVEKEKDPTKHKALLDQADKLFGIGDLLNKAAVNRDAGLTESNTVAKILSGGKEANWQTTGDIMSNVRTDASFNKFSVAMDQVWTTAGTSLGKNFTPIIEDLVKFINDNKDTIKKFFDNLSFVISTLVEKLGPALELLAKGVGKIFGDLADAMGTDEKKKNVALWGPDIGNAMNDYSDWSKFTDKATHEEEGKRYASKVVGSAGDARAKLQTLGAVNHVTINNNLNDSQVREILGYAQAHPNVKLSDITNAMTVLHSKDSRN